MDITGSNINTDLRIPMSTRGWCDAGVVAAVMVLISFFLWDKLAFLLQQAGQSGKYTAQEEHVLAHE
jgi:hypothetical protein